jgi:hypothetical protein
MDPIEAALSFLSSLEPEETPNYTQIAKKSGCDRSTLSKRHRGVQGSKREQYEWLQLLTPEQEKYLVKYIDTLSKRALPPSKSMICNFAREISKKELESGGLIALLNAKILTLYSSGVKAWIRSGIEQIQPSNTASISII